MTTLKNIFSLVFGSSNRRNKRRQTKRNKTQRKRKGNRLMRMRGG